LIANTQEFEVQVNKKVGFMKIFHDQPSTSKILFHQGNPLSVTTNLFIICKVFAIFVSIFMTLANMAVDKAIKDTTVAKITFFIFILHLAYKTSILY